MKKILLSFFCLFVAQNIYACPNLLNSDMRILDSAETQNLCAYEGKTLLVVNVASRCGYTCLLYTSPSPRDRTRSRMPSSA